MLIQFSIVYSSVCPASSVTLPSLTSTVTEATLYGSVGLVSTPSNSG
jgi:hypothetical protein